MAFSQSQEFIWNGTSLATQLQAAIEAAMEDAGVIGKEVAQANARVKTGAMRDSIEATVESLPQGVRLTLSVGTDHGLFNELGTSRMSAQPMVRPGMDAAAQALPHLLATHCAEIR